MANGRGKGGACTFLRPPRGKVSNYNINHRAVIIYDVAHEHTLSVTQVPPVDAGPRPPFSDCVRATVFRARIRDAKIMDYRG